MQLLVSLIHNILGYFALPKKGMNMKIEHWGIYNRTDKRLGFAFYKYADGRLKLKWREFHLRYCQRYDGSKPWHRSYITEVLDNQVFVDNEIEAWAMLEIVD